MYPIMSSRRTARWVYEILLILLEFPIRFHRPPLIVDFALQVLCEYVWLGSSGSDLRSKTRVLDVRPTSVEEIPCIVVDGRSGHETMIAQIIHAVCILTSVMLLFRFAVHMDSHPIKKYF